MASYEYSDKYFDVYYLFVTDVDAGSGAEGVPTVHVTSSDTGSSIEANSNPKVSALTDTGTAAEATSIHATLSSTDTGSGVDVGVVTQFKSSADTGSGTEGTTYSIKLSDGDTTNAQEYDPIGDTDTGSFSDVVLPFQPNDIDAGAGTDIEAHFHITPDESEELLFTELLDWRIKLTEVDAFAAVETAIGGKKITDTDAGTGIETQAAHPGALDGDTGSFAEASSIHATTNDADAVTANEAEVSITSPVSSSDTGSVIDVNAPVNVMSADTGSFTGGNYRHYYTDTYPFGSEEACIGVTAADTGTVNPVIGEIGIFPNNKFDMEMGHAVEASSISVTLSSADSGSVVHNIDWPLGENEHVRIPEQTDLMMEAFSVSHASILNGTTGAEAAQLYGCKAGTVTLNFASYDNNADDWLIGEWYDLTNATVQVDAAFLSWAAIEAYGGEATHSSDGIHLGFSVWKEYMSTLPPVPVLLRAPSKDAYNNPRTIDIVLYCVQLNKFSIDNVSFKNGVTFSYAGFATYSTDDEAGNPLPSNYYSNATGMSIGRIISSPGNPQVGVLAGSLYGEGT